MNKQITYINPKTLFNSEELKKMTKLSKWEKLILFFIKKQYFVDGIEGVTIVYKEWKGKVFILNHFNTPPMHPMCRCETIPKKETK